MRPLWVRVPPLPPHRGGPTAKTPGPQPGGRGSTPRRGTNQTNQAMPGSRRARRPVVTRKVGVRAPPWQQQHRVITRWPRSEARGCSPRDEGANPSRVSIAIRCVGMGVLPTKQHPADWEVRCKPEGLEPAVPLPRSAWFTDRLVVVVQGRGPQPATLKMRVRIPPTTPCRRSSYGRTLVSYSRSSGFDSRRRPHLA